jgi:hypothetical protein
MYDEDSQSLIVPETQPPESQIPETQPPESQIPETQHPETQPPESQIPETQPDNVVNSLGTRLIYSATYMTDLFLRLLDSTDETPESLKKLVVFVRTLIKRVLPPGISATVLSKVDELLEPTPKFLVELKESAAEWCKREKRFLTQLKDSPEEWCKGEHAGQPDRPPARLLGVLYSLINSYSSKGYMHDSPTPMTHVPFVYTTVTGIVSDVIYCFKLSGSKKRQRKEEDADIKRKRKRDMEEEMNTLPPCICGLQSVKTFTSFPTNDDELPHMYCSRKCLQDDEAAEAAAAFSKRQKV